MKMHVFKLIDWYMYKQFNKTFKLPSCDEVSKKTYRSWCSEVHIYLKPKQIKLAEFIKHVLILCQKVYMHIVSIIVYNPNVSIQLFCFYKDSNHDILTTSLNLSEKPVRGKLKIHRKKIGSIPYALYHIYLVVYQPWYMCFGLDETATGS